MSAAFPIILHHFDQSPFSEKVRIVFGLKNIAWTSVRISRIMPRPDLMPLTGGYRRTPVMQIGADIYCDTQCIIRELERRFPEPTLYPDGSEGVAWATIIHLVADCLNLLRAIDRRIVFGPPSIWIVFHLFRFALELGHCST
jgi:glutathione S-transferase